MKTIKKVRMVFAEVNYPVSERGVKESVILADFDELLCDLMQECIVKGNNKTLQDIIKIVHNTNFPVNHHCERVADIAESTILGLEKLTDDVEFELPSYEKMRVMRVFGAIFQAIGYQAKQWEEALPLNNNKASLQSLYDDLCEMEDYYYNLLSLMTDLDSKYVNSSYSLMRMDAFNMISDAKTAVWRKLHKDDETN